MPRFITVTVRCDWEDCTIEGVEGDGNVTERTIAIDGKPPKAFLICINHGNELDDIVMPLLLKGIKVEGKAAVATGTIECKECGRTDIKNKAGLAQHVIRSHEFESLAAYEAKFHIHIE